MLTGHAPIGQTTGMDSLCYDVAVLGAGVQGSSTAYYLTQKAGVEKVLLLEQFSALHSRGSSHGSSRITRRAYSSPFYVKMMNEAYQMWSALEQESNTRLYEKTGYLVFGPESGPAVKKNAECLGVHKIPYQELTASEANKKYSKQLSLPETTACLYTEDGGILMAKKAVAAYQKMFQSAGGMFLDEHPVTEIVPGEVITIRTTKGSFRTKKLVITAGSWASSVLSALGIDLPLKVLRNEAVYWKADTPENFSKENFPVFSVESSALVCDFYGLPIHEYPGLIKICDRNGVEISHPDQRDCSAGHSDSIKTISDFIGKHFKGVAAAPSIVEPCMFTSTPDENPVLDCHPVHTNIIIGAGFSGHGFKLSPVVGKILSELALERTLSYDLSPFKLDRF